MTDIDKLDSVYDPNLGEKKYKTGVIILVFLLLPIFYYFVLSHSEPVIEKNSVSSIVGELSGTSSTEMIDIIQ